MSLDRLQKSDGLVIGERPEPEVPQGWAKVTVKAASLNHHDLWSLRGVGLREEALPMILGCDAAGYDEDGNEKQAITADGDLIGFDARLAISGLKYRFLKAKGLEYGEELRDFTSRMNKLAKRVNGAVLDLYEDEGRVI